MHSSLLSMVVACCVVAFAGATPPASADQGKGKGQAKSGQAKSGQAKGKTQGRTGHAQNKFAGLDRDGNGVITRSEWAGNDTSFANQDWNGDGVLSGEEIRPGAPRPGRGNDDPRFDRWDINRDGVLTRSEWRGSSEAFNRLDLNRDGVLSRSELPPSVVP